MSGDLATMKTRIASEMVRPDLLAGGQIASAISDAIAVYQSDRFYFNEPTLITEPTFNTVIGQSTYDSTANANIRSSLCIDYLTYVQANSTFKITRRSPLDIQLANQQGTISGPPNEFTFAGMAITIYPVPDNIYPIFMFGQLASPPPQTDNEVGNPWMVDAEQLIRCRAKFELAVHVTRNPTMAQAMSPDVDGGPGGQAGATSRAWSNLKKQSNVKTSLGRIQPMQF